MKNLWMVLLVTCACHVQADDEAYQQCLLQYQSKVEVPQVVGLVRSACDHIHRELALLPRKKAYWQCVLDYIPPVKTPEVIADLLQACREQHDFRK